MVIVGHHLIDSIYFFISSRKRYSFEPSPLSPSRGRTGRLRDALALLFLLASLAYRGDAFGRM